MPRPMTVTSVRRCLEEWKGGLELVWSHEVALKFQRWCERQITSTGSSSSSSLYDVQVTGHTTPAVSDIGRGSLRVRFLKRHRGSGNTTSTESNTGSFPTGGLLLGVRRQPFTEK